MIMLFLSSLFISLSWYNGALSTQNEVYSVDQYPFSLEASTKQCLAHTIDTTVMPALTMVPLVMKACYTYHRDTTVKHCCMFLSTLSGIVGIECGCKSLCHALYESDCIDHHDNTSSRRHQKIKRRLAQYAVIGCCGSILFGIISHQLP